MAVVSPAFGSIVPSQKQQLLSTNYLNFADGSGNDFAQQYLPEIYEQEVERYGNRTLSGFLRMVGAEMPMTSDQVVWSEQNRLHIAYDGLTATAATTIRIVQSASVQGVISQNQTIVVMNTANGDEVKCLVTGVTGTSGTTGNYDLTVLPYTQADLAGGGAGEVTLCKKVHNVSCTVFCFFVKVKACVHTFFICAVSNSSCVCCKFGHIVSICIT